MLVPPLVPQNVRRDRFLSVISRSRRVYGVQGEQGLARRASRRMRGRDASLFWSDEATAARWAASVASNPRVKEFSLTEMLASVLPGLSEHSRLDGLDWDGEETMVELDPRDFANRLRAAAPADGRRGGSRHRTRITQSKPETPGNARTIHHGSEGRATPRIVPR